MPPSQSKTSILAVSFFLSTLLLVCYNILSLYQISGYINTTNTNLSYLQNSVDSLLLQRAKLINTLNKYRQGNRKLKVDSLRMQFDTITINFFSLDLEDIQDSGTHKVQRLGAIVHRKTFIEGFEEEYKIAIKYVGQSTRNLEDFKVFITVRNNELYAQTNFITEGYKSPTKLLIRGGDRYTLEQILVSLVFANKPTQSELDMVHKKMKMYFIVFIDKKLFVLDETNDNEDYNRLSNTFKNNFNELIFEAQESINKVIVVQ